MPPGIGKRSLQILAYLLVLGVTLFCCAGRLDWSLAWVFLGIALLSVLITGARLLHRNVGLIAERTQMRSDTEPWDKVISGLYGLCGLLVLIVAGLDERMIWSTLPPRWTQVMGGLGFLLGNLIASSAMWANAFFATTVRIQDQRGHSVITTGPYSWVRHPGYSGWLLSQLSIPFLLGSIIALVPAILAMLFLVIRTAREDRFLKNKLAGYSDYALAVRYRLIPQLW